MLNIKSGLLGMIVLSIFVLSSCSLDPIDKNYSKHTAEDDFRRIKEISNEDSADVALLGKYMVEHGLAGPQVMEIHATYHDILEEAKKEKERYEIEKRKKGKINQVDIAKSHEMEKLKNLKKVLYVDFVREENTEDETAEINPKKGKKPAPVVNKNLITFDVMFKNTGEKDIRAIKGDINFYDIFHSEIKKVTFTSFKQVNIGDSIVQKFTIDLNEVNKPGNTYSGLNKDFIKVEWLPDRLIYTDDTVVE